MQSCVHPLAPERDPIPGIFKFGDAAIYSVRHSDFEYEIHIRERYFTTSGELVHAKNTIDSDFKKFADGLFQVLCLYTCVH